MKTHPHAFPTLIALTIAAAAGIPSASGQSFWINEFHYDNAGTDTGEFVEVIAPAAFTDLSSVRVTLYNGGDGTPYGSSHLLNTFTPGATVSDFRIYSKTINGLQNGAPDGFSLDVGGAVQQFISYEGHFTAASGPASGMVSSDVGFTETEATAVGSSIGLTGTGRDLSEFAWNSASIATRGTLNVAQDMTAVPEPQTYALAAGIALGGFAFWRRRNRVGPAAGPFAASTLGR